MFLESTASGNVIVVKDVCPEAQARAMIRDFKEEARSYTDSFQSKAWIYRLPRPGALVHVMWEICYSQFFCKAIATGSGPRTIGSIGQRS